MAASALLSIRVSEELQNNLDGVAEAQGESRSAVIKRLLEEGLRMERHPGVIFRSGPGGRRAGLAGGPDIWEIVRVLRNAEVRGEGAVSEAARWLDLSMTDVRIAARYYAACPGEIDDWIARVDQAAEAEADLAQRERVLLS